MEEWRSVSRFKDRYEVSNYGRVRSLDRVVMTRLGVMRRVKGKVLKAEPNTGGYLSLRLGRGNPVMVHTLVAKAFLGRRPPGAYVCHRDGVKANNFPRNLRYATPKENQADRKVHGTYLSICGERSHMAVLTETQVRQIKRLLSTGKTHSEIAKAFPVTRGAISAISSGRNWKYLG